MRKRFLMVWGLGAAVGFAQDPEGDVEILKGLMATPVIAANLQLTPIRESPGILTVITQADLRASGARDLIDALKMVPGFDFASDTQGVVGLGVRGNWGHDGKVLLLIDGLEMTEPLYGTLQFGNHYPIGDIDRIEIIRGPGSALYGQFAELAVINILTRREAQAEGATAQFWGGGMTGTAPASLAGQVTYGHAWGAQGFTLSYAGGGVASGSGPWPTSAGTVQAGHFGGLRQDFLNLGYSWENLNFRYLRDGYSVYDYTREGAAFPSGNKPLSFDGQYFGVDYTWRLGAWELKPALSLKEQLPWTYTEAHTDKDTRGVAKVLAVWAGPRAVTLTLGAEATQDDANIYWSSRHVRQEYVFQNHALLGQLRWTSPLGNLDLGARVDHNSEFGSVTSPRIAFTRAEDEWHFKLLAAGAFRAPSIENLFDNPGLLPERTRSLEAEGGMALSAHNYLSVNLFDERIANPISYSVLNNNYMNFNQVGSRGLEMTLRSQYADFSCAGSLTLQNAQDHQAPFYSVPGADGFHIGFAQVKAALQPQWRFLPGWTGSANVLMQGPRYYYPFNQTTLSRLGPTTTLDLFVNHAYTEHLDLGLRLMNATNAYNPFIQAYGNPGAGGDPPLPGRQRELDLKLALKF